MTTRLMAAALVVFFTSLAADAAETWKAGDDMVMADLDASLLAESSGRRWIRARRPQLYTPLTVPTGLECDTRKLKFEE